MSCRFLVHTRTVWHRENRAHMSEMDRLFRALDSPTDPKTIITIQQEIFFPMFTANKSGHRNIKYMYSRVPLDYRLYYNNMTKTHLGLRSKSCINILFDLDQHAGQNLLSNYSINSSAIQPHTSHHRIHVKWRFAYHWNIFDYYYITKKTADNQVGFKCQRNMHVCKQLGVCFDLLLQVCAL